MSWLNHGKYLRDLGIFFSMVLTMAFLSWFQLSPINKYGSDNKNVSWKNFRSLEPFSDYAAASICLLYTEICIYARLNRKSVQDENIFREIKMDRHAWWRIKKSAGSPISILIHVGKWKLVHISLIIQYVWYTWLSGCSPQSIVIYTHTCIS